MVTFGSGEVLFDGSANKFELRYKGVIRITDSPDNLFIEADRRTIKGIMLNDSDLPNELFNYVGEFRLLSFKSSKDDITKREPVTLQGVDYWELDNEKWEDDGSLWGTRNGTYLVGSKQRFDKHSLVVNNNIKTQYDGQFLYSDNIPVPANELIHIHADNVVMTGGVHTEDSVQIYPYKDKTPTRKISQTRQATTTHTSSSGGGGGY
jgi:hypothetical protein